MTEEQTEPGQRLTERLFRRASRRHLIGPGSSFYKRFGLADPLAPTEGESESGGFVFLSGASYYAERDAWLGKYSDLYARLGFFSSQGRTAAWLSRGSAGVRSRLVELALAGLPEPVLLGRHDLDEQEQEEQEATPSRVAKRSRPSPRRAVNRKLQSLRELLTELGPKVSDALLRSFEAVALEQASGGEPVSEARVVRATLKRLPAPIARSVRQRLRRRAQRRPDALAPQIDVAAGRASEVPGVARRGLRRVIRAQRQAARSGARTGTVAPARDLQGWLPEGPVRTMAGWEELQDPTWDSSLEPLPVQSSPVVRVASTPEVVWLETGDVTDEEATSSEPAKTRSRGDAVRRVASRAVRPTLMDLRPSFVDTQPLTERADTPRETRIRSIARAAARAVHETSDRVDLAASPIRSTHFEAHSAAPDLVLPVFLQDDSDEGEQWARAARVTSSEDRGGARVSASRHAVSRQVAASDDALVASPVSVPASRRPLTSRAAQARRTPSSPSFGRPTTQAPRDVVTTVRATRRAADQVRRDRRGRAMVSPAPLAVERRLDPVTRSVAPQPVWLQPAAQTDETITPAPIRRASRTGTPAPVRRQPSVEARPARSDAGRMARAVSTAPAAAAVARMERVVERAATRSVLPVVAAQVPQGPLLDKGPGLEEPAPAESAVVRAVRRRWAASWDQPSVASSPVSYLLDPIQESEMSWVIPEGDEPSEPASPEVRTAPRALRHGAPETGVTPAPTEPTQAGSARARSTVRASQRAVTSVTRSERGLAPRVIQSESPVDSSPSRPFTEIRGRLGSGDAPEVGRASLSPLRRAEIRQQVGREERGSPLPAPFAYLDERPEGRALEAASSPESNVGSSPVEITQLTAEAAYRISDPSAIRPMARAAARSGSSHESELLSASPLANWVWPQGLSLQGASGFSDLPLSVTGQDGVTRVWAAPQMVWGEPTPSSLEVSGRAFPTRAGRSAVAPRAAKRGPDQASSTGGDRASVSPSVRAARRLGVARGEASESDALLPRPMAYVDTWSEPELAPWGEAANALDAGGSVETSATALPDLSLLMAEEESSTPTATPAPRRRARKRGPRRGVRPSRRAHARLDGEGGTEWGWRGLDSDPSDRLPEMVAVGTEEGGPTVPGTEPSLGAPTKRSRRLNRAAVRASTRGEVRVRRDSRGKTLLAPAVSLPAEPSPLEPVDPVLSSPAEWMSGGVEPLAEMPDGPGMQSPPQIGIEAADGEDLPLTRTPPVPRIQVPQVLLEEGGAAQRGFSWKAMDRASNPVGLLPSVQRAWDAFEPEASPSVEGVQGPRMQVPVAGAAPDEASSAAPSQPRPRRRAGSNRSDMAEWTATPVSRRRRTPSPRGRQADRVEPALLDGPWDEEELTEDVDSPIALAESRLTDRTVQRVARKSGNLLTALARARAPEDVVRAILERSDQVGSLGSVLPNSATRLVERIALAGQTAAQADDAQQGSQGERDKATRGRTRASRRRSAQARTGLRPSRVYRGSMSTPTAASEGHQGMGANHVMKLAGKLMNLIHLAESERRMSEAQGHVRMAEDTDSARAEGSMEPDAEQADAPVDMSTLKKTVLDSVMREIELLQARREDPDGNQWW